MRPSFKPQFPGWAACAILLCVLFTAAEARAASTLTGFVYDKQRNPLAEIDVELLNDFYQNVGRARTDGSGRYSFSGLSDGRYTIRVYAFRYDLIDQEIPVEIITQNIRGGEGTGYYTQDFYLQPKKGGLAETETGIVFAQEVPAGAKAAFERAIRHFQEKKSDQGIMALNDAIRIFPDYFYALHRMGKELTLARRYQEAAPFLLKAAEINSKSATSLYYLGLCFHHMGREYNKAAAVAFNNAYVIAPESIQVLYMLGKTERSEGKFAEAEKHLLKAVKIARVGVPEIHMELAGLYSDDLKRYEDGADELELYLKASKVQGEESVKVKKIIARLRDKAAKSTKDKAAN